MNITAARNISIIGATAGDYGTLLIDIGATGSGINFGTSSNRFPGNTYSFSGFNKRDIYGFYYDGTDFYWTYNLNY